MKPPMDISKERVTIAKKVENAPMNRVAIVDSLVEDEVDHFSPDQIHNILAHFARIVKSCSESEAMTRPRLHELLHQAIADTDEDSFQMVGDLVDDSHAHICVCLHTDGPIGHRDGMVEVSGEVRDMYSGRDVYWILDEGCNSICHSSPWADDATGKLNAMGYKFPFKTTESKNFAGLGSKGSNTEGLRKMPFP